jgi:translation initiation factor 1
VSAKERLVYSTGKGRVCPKCGWPVDDCRCSSSLGGAPEPVPEKIRAKLRLEKRVSGKNVTVVDGLPRNGPLLDGVLKELKKACGTGGRAGDGSVEIQGDQRERLRELLARRGWTVKG